MTGSGHLLRNVRRHPLLRRRPSPLQGPSERLNEARSATKEKGVPVPRAGGRRRGRVKRSGASRPRGRETPGKKALGPRRAEAAGPPGRGVALTAWPPGPSGSVRAARAGRGPRSRRGGRRPNGRLLQAVSATLDGGLERREGGDRPARGQLVGAPGARRARGVPPAAPATSGRDSPQAAAPTPAHLLRAGSPACPRQRPRVSPGPGVRTRSAHRNTRRPATVAHLAPPQAEAALEGAGRDAWGGASVHTWSRRAGALRTRGGRRGAGAGPGLRRGGSTGASWGPEGGGGHLDAESPRGSRFLSSSPGAADPAKNENVKECVLARGGAL
ncbi:unnamed protein product [Rangifer tarandus platyrhynchus]|uniref:Collagen alpha-1(I) chain-like n=1 Tax=Rangifer tarandus platyrhynchus TaxID=3082113 RepID=A0ABN8Y7C8_RANTA|nr:unnamed protein product [Rangifer tarandus platyrhynchus]